MALHRPCGELAEKCPIRGVLDRLGDRWTVLVLIELGDGDTLRFTELKRRIEDISPRMLAQTLRHLEEDGLVRRTVHATVPPKVEYTLTPLGASFFERVQGLIAWADEHQPAVRAARAAYVAPVAHDAL